MDHRERLSGFEPGQHGHLLGAGTLHLTDRRGYLVSHEGRRSGTARRLCRAVLLPGRAKAWELPGELITGHGRTARDRNGAPARG